MLKLKRTMTATAIGVALLIGLVAERASAYQLFTDRDTWNSAIAGKSILTEDFNSAPNGFVETDRIFPSGLKFVDSGFFGGAEVSQGALRVGLAFPGSVEQFTFPTPIEGFGFDFGNLLTGDYADKLFSVRGIFGSSDVLPKNGFFGVVAEAGDSLIGSFQTLGRGEIGSLSIDNVSFTRSVPETGNAVAISVLGLGLLLVKNKTKE